MKLSNMSKHSNKIKIGQYCDKGIIVSLVLMFLIIPLIVDPHITSFDLAKVTAMRILTLGIIGIWILKIALTNECQFIRTPLDIPILAFLIISILATINGLHPYMSLIGEYKRYDGLITTINYISIYYIVVNFLRERKYIKRTIAFITFASVLVAGCGILQSYGIDLTKWESGVISTMGNPNFLGGYLAIVFFFPLTLFFLTSSKKKNLLKRVVFLGLCLGSVVVIYKCFSLLTYRGGVLGLLAGILLFGILLIRQFIKNKLRALVFLVVMSIATTIFFLRGQSAIFQKFATTVKVEKEEGKAIPTLTFTSTAATRVHIWHTCWEIVKHYPLLGVGPDALRLISPKYEKIEFIRLEGGRNCLIDKAHMEILDISVTRGLLGLAAYLWIIILLLRFVFSSLKLIKEENKILLVGVLSGIISYLVQNEVGFGIIATSSLFWLLLGIAIPIGMPKTQKIKSLKIPPPIRIIICIPLLVLICYLIYLSIRPYIADIYYKNGLAMVHFGNIDQAIASYEKALKYNPTEEFYYGEVLNAYNIKFNQTQDMFWLDTLIKKGEEAVRCNPFHPYYYNLLSSAYGEKYVRVGDEVYAKKSIEASKNALKYKPLFADPHNNLAAIYVRQGRYDEAIKEMEQASFIFPDDYNYLRILGELYQVKGQINKAIKLLKEAIEYNPKNTDLYAKLGKIYFDKKRYKEAEIQFKKAIELAPNNIFARNNLGTIYINQQRFKEAKDEFESVLKVEPQNNYAIQMLALIRR